MNIGIPKETRPYEFRVGLSPAGVEILAQHKHFVYVEHDAGVGAGFSDQEYEKAGARIAYSSDEVLRRSDMLLKVARPFKSEMEALHPGAILMGLLHLASAQENKIEVLLNNKITAVAYEQIALSDGSLPVLRPLSQIGGLMSAQVAARLLQNNWGGKGILMGGVPGVPPAEVAIIGGGVVGTYATQNALGLGAHVTVLDRNLSTLQRFLDRFPNIVTMVSTQRNIERVTSYADVVIVAALIPGQRAPILITREMVQKMKPRSVIMDISIDEGGCVETSRPTTHEHPIYFEEGIMHYCVPNMPGIVARTATHAFVNAAMPYILEIANKGIEKAREENPAIETAICAHDGKQCHLSRLAHRKDVDDGLE